MITDADVKKLKAVFATKDDLAELEKAVDQVIEEKMNFLPTKKDFFDRMDKLSHEIQDMRDESALHLGSHDELDERLSRVEKKLGIATAV